MDSDPLYSDPELARFYDIENVWDDDFEYCKNLAAGRLSVLDLGCGTGMFAATVARGRQRSVVGVDTARPMLDIARRRSGGGEVRWIEEDARRVRLNERFDLVVMTGHSFQVFLKVEDQLAALRTIRWHLAPEGRFAFDSRNPAVAPWTKWTPTDSKRVIKHPSLGEVIAWNDASLDPTTSVVTYKTYYKIVADAREYSCHSRIAFPSHDRLAPMMEEAGLVVERWLGDWSGAPYTSTAPEMIAVGKLR
jgi:ubiquinone/menaquinone biosynthesis C-methylase UbiE